MYNFTVPYKLTKHQSQRKQQVN